MPHSGKVVLLALPSASSRLHTSILEFVATFPLYRPDVVLVAAAVPKIWPVATARNAIAGLMRGQPQCTHLWMIDDDVVVAEDAHRLLDVDADIVTARVPVWLGRLDQDGKPYHAVTIPAAKAASQEGKFDFVYSHERGPVAIDACGTGCILIRRQVLDDPRMSVGQTDDGKPVLFRTLQKQDGSVDVGEDIDFTWRARQLGYTIVLEGSVRCGHEKIVDLADVEAWGTRGKSVVEKKPVAELLIAPSEITTREHAAGGPK